MNTSGTTGSSVFAGMLDPRPVDGCTPPAQLSSREPDDESLLKRIQESDMEALGLFFRRYAKLTLGIARRVLRDTGEAEDLVHDIFLFLFFKCKLFDPSKGSALSWLIQLAYSRALDRRRYLSVRSLCDRNKGAIGTQALLSAIDPATENTEQFFAWQSFLRPALAELSEDQRRTVVLYQ